MLFVGGRPLQYLNPPQHCDSKYAKNTTGSWINNWWLLWILLLLLASFCLERQWVVRPQCVRRVAAAPALTVQSDHWAAYSDTLAAFEGLRIWLSDCFSHLLLVLIAVYSHRIYNTGNVHPYQSRVFCLINMEIIIRSIVPCTYIFRLMRQQWLSSNRGSNRRR